MPMPRREIDPNTFPTIYRGGQGVEIQKLTHRHLAIMDFMLANPIERMAAVAEAFNVTGPWLSTVVHSDLFQARLNTRRSLMEDAQHKRIAARLADTAELGVEAMHDAMQDEEVPVGMKHSIAKTSLEALGILGKSASAPAQGPAIVNNIYQVSPNVLAQSKARMEKIVPINNLELPSPDA